MNKIKIYMIVSILLLPLLAHAKGVDPLDNDYCMKVASDQRKALDSNLNKWVIRKAINKAYRGADKKTDTELSKSEWSQLSRTKKKFIVEGITDMVATVVYKFTQDECSNYINKGSSKKEWEQIISKVVGMAYKQILSGDSQQDIKAMLKSYLSDQNITASGMVCCDQPRTDASQTGESGM